MTLQTKRFIELADILSLRFECKECGASVALPPDGDAARATASCPACYKPWAVVGGMSYQQPII
jgi:uncharacterized paraquat-inducible protein A